MSKIVLSPVNGTYDVVNINANFDAIKNALENQVLYRDNPAGNPNMVKTDVDMNSKRLINLPKPQSPTDAARLVDLGEESIKAQEAAAAAAASAAAAAISETNSTDQASQAASRVGEIQGYANAAIESREQAAQSATSAATSAQLAYGYAQQASVGQINSDWNETNAVSKAYIFNKPNVPVLDGSNKIPAAYLPSYVDDVLEYAGVPEFPVTGEGGKIYIDIATKKIYRWSGSAYIEISPGPGSTDAVPEGVTNRYFTDARARSAVVNSPLPGNILFNNGDGVWAKDTGGTPRQIVNIGGDNNLNFTVAGGGAVNFYNQAGTSVVWQFLNNGDSSQIGNHIFKNDRGVFLTDTGGTTRPAVYMGQDNNTYFRNTGAGLIIFASIGGSTAASLNNSGTFSAVDVIATSDETKKDNFRQVDGLIPKLAAITKYGVFDWKEGGVGVGVGAQSLEEVIPEAVTTNADGIKQVRLGTPMYVMIEMAKEIEALKEQLKQLTEKLNA